MYCLIFDNCLMLKKGEITKSYYTDCYNDFIPTKLNVHFLNISYNWEAIDFPFHNLNKNLYEKEQETLIQFADNWN